MGRWGSAQYEYALDRLCNHGLRNRTVAMTAERVFIPRSILVSPVNVVETQLDDGGCFRSSEMDPWSWTSHS